MLKALGVLGVAGAIVLGGAATAWAVPVNFAFSGGNVTLVDYSSNTGVPNRADEFAGTYGAVVPAGATFTPDPTVTPPPGSITNTFKSPFADTPLENSQSYFSVGGGNATDGTSASPAVLTFAPGAGPSTFSLLWGSIDSYNTLTFLLSNAQSVVFTGTTILQDFGILPSGGGSNYDIVGLFNFAFDNAISSITFGSTSAAFEMAFVPVPAAGLLLLTGIGGLFGLSRFRRKPGATATA